MTETLFTGWESFNGPLRYFCGDYIEPERDIDAEWLAWVLAEFVREGPGYLIFDGPVGYIQSAVYDDGNLLAEAQSNTFRDDHVQLEMDHEFALLDLGWSPPTYADEVPADRDRVHSPNFFRHWPAPAPFMEAATLAFRTLAEVYGCLGVGDLHATYFRPGHSGSIKTRRRRR